VNPVSGIEPFAVEIPRDVLRVEGPDALSFLQGQLSQDLESIALWSSAWSFLLQPQGKVDAWLRITRVADDAVVIDVDAGFGEAVTERLERFKLRTKATISPLPWGCIAVRGARVPNDDAQRSVSGGIIVDPEWSGVEAVDIVGASAVVPGGVRGGTLEEYEALRIECGVPAMGRELTSATIPAEAGVIDRSVSFTKGCYTGQELVARIDSRGGNVPRHLRGIVIESDTAPDVGEVVRSGDAEVGTLTSVAWSARLERPVALAYVKRSVEPPAAATVAGRVAQIESLPLLRSTS
jgi:folate-binding protein YgfZ